MKKNIQRADKSHVEGENEEPWNRIEILYTLNTFSVRILCVSFLKCSLKEKKKKQLFKKENCIKIWITSDLTINFCAFQYPTILSVKSTL